ncbi:hypothetical protein AA313_de0206185 [Arthrobotrys entomopaga]|nr:hypothetical protein AA313_de0206185 [Arthrobotrys entomopaga]
MLQEINIRFPNVEEIICRGSRIIMYEYTGVAYRLPSFEFKYLKRLTILWPSHPDHWPVNVKDYTESEVEQLLQAQAGCRGIAELMIKTYDPEEARRRVYETGY